MKQALHYVVNVNYRLDSGSPLASRWRREIRPRGWGWLVSGSAGEARESVRWVDPAGGPPLSLWYAVGFEAPTGDTVAAELADAALRREFPESEIVG